MKARLFALAVSSVLLISPAIRAGDTTATPPPGSPPPHRDGPPRGMLFLIPPQMIEKLNLTDDQKAKIKSIEEGFAKSQQEYFTTHKDEIEAARKAMDAAMSGLQEQRKAAMEAIKSLLTQEQMNMMPHGGPRGEGHGLNTPAVKPPPAE